MATRTNPFQFLQQVRAEVAKVVWPTRRETMLTTIMVLIMAALTSVFFFLIDSVIRTALRLVLMAFN
jgi:preprotein translocase subunit SecE